MILGTEEPNVGGRRRRRLGLLDVGAPAASMKQRDDVDVDVDAPLLIDIPTTHIIPPAVMVFFVTDRWWMREHLWRLRCLVGWTELLLEAAACRVRPAAQTKT